MSKFRHMVRVARTGIDAAGKTYEFQDGTKYEVDSTGAMRRMEPKRRNKKERRKAKVSE